jgi:DNA-binding FrmR family transcriptional regulator
MTSAPGYLDRKDDVLRRLRRIEGQVRGLERMVEEETYCIDVLTQVAATTKALQAVAVQLLHEHLRRCVLGVGTVAATDGTAAVATTADERSADELLNEATRAVERLLRT